MAHSRRDVKEAASGPKADSLQDVPTGAVKRAFEGPPEDEDELVSPPMEVPAADR